jgi:hypothetical protein
MDSNQSCTVPANYPPCLCPIERRTFQAIYYIRDLLNESCVCRKDQYYFGKANSSANGVLEILRRRVCAHPSAIVKIVRCYHE